MNDQLRRRSVGAPAARSVLLMTLGQYVMDHHEDVWQETLVEALGELGHKPQAARQAVARSITAGWLDSERVGRRSRLRLTGDSRAMLESGGERILSFGEPWAWDGEWLLVVLRVPEEHREERHRMRTQLAWAGFGSLGGGLWLSPHVEREDELRRKAEGSPAELLSFRAQLGTLGEPAKIIGEAWDLDALAAGYERFIEQTTATRPETPAEVFHAATLLWLHWRRFVFLDPDLPERMLPDGWPRRRAFELFRARHEAWYPTAQEHFSGLEARREPPVAAR